MLTHAELRALLPQRWPMLLLDRVDELEPGVRITAVKAVTGAEPCYQDLPDGLDADRYAYPFPLVLESFGQACAVLWRASTADDPGGVLMFAAARDCVPRATVNPGDVLRHEARLEHVVPGTAFACGSTWVGDREVATFGSLVAVTRPAGQIEPRGAGRRAAEMTPNRGEEDR
ncbi:beta-hydroxyacyl-ACP dehydratase [Dactylosporangium sp. NPDC000244]|uniref:3-hydroxyacyl-ACP dehydratase FabZ family protein n=1 Tax=Dactylosporangium sp. NPDC000244 TaxID=3154365 RepID=UPI00332B4C30